MEVAENNFVISLFNIILQILYCMSKKSCPNSYSNLLYKIGQDIMDKHYWITAIPQGRASSSGFGREGGGGGEGVAVLICCFGVPRKKIKILTSKNEIV